MSSADAAQSTGGPGAAKPKPANGRIDARVKVTGEARFGSDVDGGRSPAHACLVTSSIARGRITAIDETAARAVPGLLKILTWRNVGDRIKPGKSLYAGGHMSSSIAPLADDRVHYDGQIVAVIVADTFEGAREAAAAVRVSYDEEKPTSTFSGSDPSDDTGAEAELPGMPSVGDAAAAFASAPVTVDAYYSTPTQHHNPMELFTTTCAWDGDKLRVWESSQNVNAFRQAIAEQLSIKPRDVQVISRYAGGAFGALGLMSQRTALVAYAAKLLRQVVRLETTRQQGFTTNSYRTETRQRIRIGAGSDGHLQALIHDGLEIASRADNYPLGGVGDTTRLYACPNVSSSVRQVRADRNGPGSMRSPSELPYLFALESAIDELAVALAIDPVELRRRNDTSTDPISGKPYSSRGLMRCYDEAAAAFGWSARNPAPRSMRDGDWLVGWGCASSMYPTYGSPATARVILAPDGSATVQTSANEIGQGVYTVVALTAARELGVPVEEVNVQIGDSDLPPAPGAGASTGTASICNAVAAACRKVLACLAAAAVDDRDSPFHGTDPAALSLDAGAMCGPGDVREPLNAAIRRTGYGPVEAYAETVPSGGPTDAIERLYAGQGVWVGGSRHPDRVQYAFGAQFVEVRVHARTCEVRAPRMVGAYAAGRIVNPTGAKSQLMGGQIWGLSAALHEATEIDTRAARYTNADFAGYMIPVNADIIDVETIFVPEADFQVNDLGIKGLGELGNVGLNAAVANAVHHATGVRVRELPIRIEQLLPA